MNAPKKIWKEHSSKVYVENTDFVIETQKFEPTQYIRADLVDGLVDALEETIRKMSAFIYLANEVGINDADGFYLAHAIEAEAQARAALKALEEE